MMKNSFKTNGYRIWSFEDLQEVKDVIFNEGDYNIKSNPIESCFAVKNNVKMFFSKRQNIKTSKIENINKYLSLYISKIKLITRWENSDYFDIYQPLKSALLIPDEYTNKELDILKKRLNFYEHQNEILHLGKYDNISSGEVLYIMIEKNLVDYFYDKKIDDVIYGEMNDYYLFYNDEKFRKTFKEHKIYNEFNFNFNDLFNNSNPFSTDNNNKKNKKDKNKIKDLISI